MSLYRVRVPIFTFLLYLKKQVSKRDDSSLSFITANDKERLGNRDSLSLFYFYYLCLV